MFRGDSCASALLQDGDGKGAGWWGGRDETNDGLLVASAWLAGVVEKGGACK